MTESAQLLKFPSPFSLEKGRETRPAGVQLDELLSAPDVEARVAAFDPIHLHELIHEVGLSDAMDIALLTTPEQFQVFTDLDAWNRDRFDVERSEQWMDVLLQLDDTRFEAVFDALDPEILPLYLMNHLIVWLFERGENPPVVPDEENRPLIESPCHTYLIQYPADEDLATKARELVSRLYQVLGTSNGALMLESTRWELQSDLEETAYRFRNARLEDFGFRSREDAMWILSPLDPLELRAQVANLGGKEELTVGQLGQLPRRWLDALVAADDRFFITRCLEQLDEPHWKAVESQLVALGNTVACAVDVEAGDRVAVSNVFSDAVSTVSIGMEYCCTSSLTEGVEALKKMPLSSFHRAGRGILLKIRKQALDILAGGQVTVVEGSTSLLSRLESETLEALTSARGVRSPHSGEPLRRYAEVDEAIGVLLGIAAKELLFFQILGLQLDAIKALALTDGLAVGPGGVTFGNLLSTLVLRASRQDSKEPPPIATLLTPLTVAELSTDVELWGRAFEAFKTGLESRLQEALRATLRAFIDQAAKEVAEQLGGITGTPEPRYITAVLVME